MPFNFGQEGADAFCTGHPADAGASTEVTSGVAIGPEDPRSALAAEAGPFDVGVNRAGVFADRSEVLAIEVDVPMVAVLAG